MCHILEHLVCVSAVCKPFVSQVDSELVIKAYYAGHVLGAAMFHIKVGSQSVVYTVSLLGSLCILHLNEWKCV